MNSADELFESSLHPDIYRVCLYHCLPLLNSPTVDPPVYTAAQLYACVRVCVCFALAWCTVYGGCLLYCVIFLPDAVIESLIQLGIKNQAAKIVLFFFVLLVVA